MSKKPRRPSKSAPPSSLRPIPARLLKSISDTLRPYLSECRALDLYAGEGRFGIMAIEEGAAWVEFIEKNAAQASRLKSLTARHSSQVQIHCTDVAKFLTLSLTPYAIIFADPPFDGLTPKAVEDLALAVHRHLETDGIFLVKHPARMLISASFSGYRAWKKSAVGDAALTYFVRE